MKRATTFLLLLISLFAQGQFGQSTFRALLGKGTVPPPVELVTTDIDLYEIGFRVSNTSATNAAIASMVTNYQGKGKGPYRFLGTNPLLAGTVTFSNHRWLKSVERFEVVLGAGVTLQNVVGWDENPGGALWRRKIAHGFSWYFDNGEDQQNYQQGDLFNTVAAGATSITLTTPAAASNYSPGDRVVLGGFDHQFGNWPINLRYFEWKVVLSANPTTGVVTFQNNGGYHAALKNSYNAAWQDNTYTDGQSPPLSYGKPRIWNISGSGRLTPRYAKFVGGTFAANPLDLDGGATEQIFAADTLIYQGSTFSERSHPSPSQNRYVLFDSCTMPFSEVDKIVEKVVYKNSTITGSGSGGTGADTIHYWGSTVGGPMNTSPRVLILESGHFTTTSTEPVAMPQNEGVHTRKIIVKNSVFNATGTGMQYGAIAWYCEPRTLTDYTLSGSTFLLPDNSTGRGFVKSLEKGSRLWKDDGSQFVLVQDIAFNGTQFVVETDATLTAGTWKYQRAEGIQDLGGNISAVEGLPVFGWNETRWAGDSTGDFSPTTRTATWKAEHFKTANGSDWTFPVIGNISSININVTKASTVSGPAFMEFYKGSTLVARIDLKTTGTYAFNTSGIVNGTTTQFPQPGTVMNGFWSQARVRFVDGGGSPVSFTTATMPGIVWQRTWKPYSNTP